MHRVLSMTFIILASATPAFGAQSLFRIPELSSGDLISLIAVLLMFGTGALFGLGYAVATIIRAVRETSTAKQVADRMDMLEARLDVLEQQRGNPSPESAKGI